MIVQRDERERVMALHATEEEWQQLKLVCDRDALARYYGVPVYILPPEIRREKRWWARAWAWLTRWWTHD